MYRNLYIILAGCGICLAIFAVSFSGRATFSTSGGDPVDFIFNNATEPQTLDPGIMSGQPEGALAIGLFEGLTCYHPETLQPMPGVATSWEIEGLTYSFELRQDHWWVKQGGIYEVDGQPRNVVAGDFIYAWRRHLHPETGSEYSYLLYLIEGAEEYERVVTEHWTSLINRYKQEHPDVVLVKPSSLTDPVAAEAADPAVLQADYDALEKFRNEAWERLVKVRAAGDYRLDVTLRSPAPYFLDLTSFYTLAPVPREAIEAYDRQWILPENIVTNGPYVLADWRFNSFIRLQKNLHYWETAAYAAERIASLESRAADELRSPERAELEFLKQFGGFVDNGLDTIDALAVEEQTTSLNLYINGDVDRIREVPTAVVGDLIALSESPGKQLGDVHHGVYNAAYFYNLNVDLPIFQAGPDGEFGRKVRRALALAVDRQILIDVVTRAHQEPAYRLVPAGVAGYSDLPLFGSGDYAKDLAEAKRLIDEVRAAGVRIPKLKILYNSHEAHAKVAVFIQGLWKTHLGIDVETSNQEWGVFLDSRRTGNYEIARSGWIGDYTDPNTFLDMFTSNNQNNDPNYHNPLYDRIILKYAAYILDYLATAEQRQALLDDLRSWPQYEAVVAGQRRPDGTTLGESLTAALKKFETVSASQRLDLAFEIRLLLFEVAETMLLYDQPIIPLYFYTSTQLWPRELQNMFINNRDVHPLKVLRWEGGKRPLGNRYERFPRISPRIRTAL